MNIRKLRHVIHRSLEELQATYDLSKAISLKAALITFRAKIDIQIMNRNGYKEPESVKKRLMKKHQVMIDFLEDKFKDFWDNYRFSETQPETDPKYRNKIWICWWQGLDNAPEVVKACVDSIERNAGNNEVIIITDKNYKDYVKFPDWLEEKRRKGIISRTIYSDLLRLNLLSNYGGIWIDSTFFCTGECFSEYMKLPLWSVKRPDYLHASIASGYFANYSLECDYEHRYVFAVVRDFLYEYWKRYDHLMDYLLTDYAIVLSQKHVAKIKSDYEQIKPNNKNCDELFKVLGQPYDERVWRTICKDTFLYKLTWKQSFPKEINGTPTFYGMLVDSRLKRLA